MAEARDQFEERLCKAKGWSRDYYRLYFVTLPCNCEEGPEEIPHWAKISQSDTSVLDHLAFHCPTQDQLLTMSSAELSNGR